MPSPTPVVVKRQPRNFAYHINLMLSSASNTAVTETSHSTNALVKVVYPSRYFYEL